MDTLMMKNQSLKRCFQVNVFRGVRPQVTKTKKSGNIPIPALWKTNDYSANGPIDTTEWMMFINFGAHDPNIDISDVEFESVNAKIVGQTKRFASFLFDFVIFQ